MITEQSKVTGSMMPELQDKPDVAETPAVVTAYKGFDENFRCNGGFQYEIGKTYTHEGKVQPCSSGFHACTRPSDVWSYYGPALARFALAKLSGTVVAHNEDSKQAASVIEIVEEIPLASFVKLVIADVASDAKATIAEGDSSTAASSGNYSKVASSGDSSTAGAEGKDTIAMVAGVGGYAKAGENGCFALCWNDGKRNRIVTGYVGEDGIEANVWYRVENGKLVKS